MRYRSGDDPIEYREDPRWAFDPEIKRAIESRVRLAQGKPAKTKDDEEPWMRRGFGRSEQIYIELQTSTRLGKPLSPAVFIDAVNRVRTRIKTPLITDATLDFIEAWSQPEAVRLWTAWQAGSFEPALEGSKALLAWWGGGRLTPHMKSAHNSLIHNAVLLEHFEELSRLSPAAQDLSVDVPAMIVREYSSCTRHKEDLARGFIEVGQRTLVEIARTAAELCPDVPLFTWMTFDGNMIPAWVPQRSAKRGGKLVQELEDGYRNRCHYAGFRFFGYTSEGQETEDEANEGKRKLRGGKWVRGYIETLTRSLTSPLCLGLTLDDASKVTEPWEIRRILPRIYELWPDFPLEVIVGDKLYDVEEHHRWLETNYGVHLCAVRKPSLAHAAARQITEKQHAGVASFTGEGLAFCRKHGDPDDPATALFFERLEAPSRKGMAPGKPHHPGRFRTRLRCDAPNDPCGRLNIPTKLGWSALAALPHHPHGRQALYALRLALQHQRNVAESQFSSQELSFKLGLHGAARTRIYSKDVYESLLLLSQITIGLQTLASLRHQLGIKIDPVGTQPLQALAA